MENLSSTPTTHTYVLVLHKMFTYTWKINKAGLGPQHLTTEDLTGSSGGRAGIPIPIIQICNLRLGELK